MYKNITRGVILLQTIIGIAIILVDVIHKKQYSTRYQYFIAILFIILNYFTNKFILWVEKENKN